MNKTIDAYDIEEICIELNMALGVLSAVIDAVARLEGKECRASNMLTGAYSYMHGSVEHLNSLKDEAFKKTEDAV